MEKTSGNRSAFVLGSLKKRMPQGIKRKLQKPRKAYRLAQTRLRIRSELLRNRFIEREMRKLNGEIRAKAPATRAGGRKVRIFTVWESNGIFRWLERGNRDPDTEIFHIPRSIFNDAFQILLRDYVGSPLGEVLISRYYEQRFAADRESFRAYCEAVMRHIASRYEADVFLFPKLNDDWITDLIKSTRRTRVPILVLDRECVVTPKRMEVYPPILKDVLDFEVDLLCVSNPMHEEFFKLSGYRAPMRMVGKIDSDYWSRPDLWKKREEIHPKLSPGRKQILYFSFGAQTYLNFYYQGEKRDWSSLNRDYHEVLLHLIAKYGDRIQIVYKSGGKPHRDYFKGFDHFEKELLRLDPEGKSFVPLNVLYSTFDLITTSDIVLGFQTTGMVEAMFSEKPLVYGAWGELYRDIQDTLLPLHRTPAVSYARTKDELIAELERQIEADSYVPSPETLKARKEFRETYFHRPDGMTSARVLEAARGLAR